VKLADVPAQREPTHPRLTRERPPPVAHATRDLAHEQPRNHPHADRVEHDYEHDANQRGEHCQQNERNEYHRNGNHRQRSEQPGERARALVELARKARRRVPRALQPGRELVPDSNE